MFRVRYLVIAAFPWLVLLWLFYTSSSSSSPQPTRIQYVTAQSVSCRGPRGKPLSRSPDDELQVTSLNDLDYPEPFLGSQRELGISQTWMTADGRYGPYGFGEDQKTYNRTRVEWEKVSWGALQNDCFEINSLGVSQIDQTARLDNRPRFTWKNQTKIKLTPRGDSFKATGRTILIIRAWSGYKYKPEDLWNIRSIIVEASLKTAGKYAVMLLVHVQDKEKNIFKSKENYDAAFSEANIPPELQSIAVLWDDNLLESWYDAVEEHRTMWSVNQPFQLFALHYPEFDHYWQIEIDQRFLGDTAEYLDAVSAFALNEPRKQALERATYAFNERIYGTYDQFKRRVDIANHGKSRAWGPIKIPDIKPIGPKPPVPTAEKDDFIWGVGEDADVIVTSFCGDARLPTGWVFKDFVVGFKNGLDTPRWWCPPAIVRASRALLLAVHQSQHDQGLNLPSEAILPSWALFHGLKLSYPPQPAYMRPHEPQFKDSGDDWSREPTEWLDTTVTPWFGNSTEDSPDGTSHSEPARFADMGMTWWWCSDYPRKIMDVWLAGNTDDQSAKGVLAVSNGRMYIPNMVMHPVKA